MKKSSVSKSGFRGLVAAVAFMAAAPLPALENLVLEHNVPRVFTGGTEAYAYIVYPKGSYMSPGIGSLTLDGTTMSATGLSFGGNNWQDGDLALRNGAVLNCSGTSYVSSCGYGYCHGLITLDGGSTLTIGETLCIGTGGYNTETAAAELRTQDSTLAVNRHIDWCGKVTWKMTNSVFTSTATTGYTITFGKIGGSYAYAAAAILTNRCEFVNTDFTYGGKFMMANTIPASMLLSGGSFSVGNGWLVCGSDWNGLTVVTNLTCTVDMTNGAAASVAVSSSSKFLLGAQLGSHGIMSISDGSSLSAGIVCVGNYGEGVLTIDGTSKLKAATSLTLGYGADSSGKLTLNGGTLEVASLSGGSGTSAFAVNGGTIRMLGAATLFADVGTVTVGADGFTLDTGGYAVTVARSLLGGTVRFVGGGSVTIASGVTVAQYESDATTSVKWEDAGVTERIEHSSGAATRTTPLQLEGNDTIVFDIASGASYAMDAALRAGTLDKQGGGLLSFKGATKLYANLALTAGTLEMSADASVQAGGFLVITNNPSGSPSTPPVVIKNESDVALKMSNYQPLFKRPLIKRGAGTLTLSIYSSASYDPSLGWNPFSIPGGTVGGTVSGYETASPIDFGDGTTLPSASYTSINVAEGRLVVDLTKQSIVTFAPWTVGNPQTACAAQPELVLRNGQAWSSGYFGIGPAGKADTSAVKNPKLTLQNFKINNTTYFCVAPYSTDPEMRPVVSCSNSFIQSSYFQPCGGLYQEYATRPFAELRFEAKSGLYIWYDKSGILYLRGPCRMVFDDSNLAAAQFNQRADGFSTSPRGLKFSYYNGVTTNILEFVNGAKFYSVGAATAQSAGDIISVRQTFAFDNGILEPVQTDETFTYNFDDHIRGSYFEMRGTGLVMTPSAGQTFVMQEPLYGTGGFVNRGEGTVVLSNGYAQCGSSFVVTNVLLYTGVTCAESGTIAFAGNTNANAKIAGPGTFANGTLTNATIVLAANADGTETDAPVLDFANGLVLTGTTTVDLGSSVLERPLEGNLTLTVATYTGGTPPDLTGWSLKKNAQVRKGTFTAADGAVTCVPEFKRGFVLMLR